MLNDKFAMTMLISKLHLRSLSLALSVLNRRCCFQPDFHATYSRLVGSSYSRHCFFSLRYSHEDSKNNFRKDTSSKSEEKVQGSSVTFSEVFRFSHLHLIRIISTFKIYQTALTILALPVAGYLHSLGMFTQSDLIVSFGIMSLATIMLYILSNFFMKIACIIYINQENSKVKISHLTFWGRRKDVLLDLANIVPLTDTGQKITDVCVRLETFDKTKAFIMFHHFGQIKDKESLFKILGNVKF